MGYRNYISVIDKAIHKGIKDMSIEELKIYYSNRSGEEIDEDGYIYIPCYELSREVYGLGKCCDIEFLESHIQPVFSNKEVNDYFNDEGEFYLINREGFLSIIENYRVKVLNRYKRLLKNSTDEFSIIKEETTSDYILSKINVWDKSYEYYFSPYNTNVTHEKIVSSSLYEYAIFELVRIYKTIDWDNDYVAITGW